MSRKDVQFRWRPFLNLGGILCLVFLVLCFGCQNDSGGKNKKANPFSSKEKKLSKLDSEIAKLYEEADSAKRNGKVHDARRAYEKVLVIFDENKETEGFKPNIEPYCQLGMIFEGFGQFVKAEEYYRKAMEIDPESAIPINCLGYSYISQGRLDEAIEYLQKAVDIDPMEPKFNNNLGLAYGMKKDYEKAFMCFRRVTNEANAYYNMSSIYAMNGMEDEAKRALQITVEMNPNHHEAKRMLTAYSEYERNPEEFSQPLLSGDFPGASVPYQERTASDVGEMNGSMPKNYTKQYGSIHSNTTN